VIARHVSLDETKVPGLTLYNEDDESGSETSTEQSNDISVSDADTDGMSSSDESQAHSSVHFETPDDMPQSSGTDSEHNEDTHSGSSDSNRDERNKTVRRYPARTRRAPLSWWASSNIVIATACHGTPVSMCSTSCHTANNIESDSPTLKGALASPQRESWVEAISEELHSLDLAHTWDVVPRAPAGATLRSHFITFHTDYER
jgi:hypothetical protein